ncbi:MULTISPECIES: hypothetical protein [Actinomadura]|uniref:Integral membrane protein n=1 Tax=Actinomadura yumaensis TaxID=111807 RepID=A0ABW2CAH8_9ACTN|nr:hypothetical protein [Actinomadura sp. J1-007]
MIDVAVVACTLVAVIAVPRLPPHPVSGRSARWAAPGVSLAAVVALVYANQVLFTVYVLRVHGGDPSFIARHLPSGWFAIADGPPLDAFARRFPAPDLLSVTVLRVQAFLELPFVLLAYGTVLHRLDHDLYRRVARSAVLWAASASYTLVFCLVEWDLRTPYTAQDIAIRICAAVAAPLWIRWTAARAPAPRPAGLAAFAAFALALGYIVLTVYDTALLYNLSHLRPAGPAAALAVLLLAHRLPGGEPSGPALRTIAAGLRWGLALFFVPALAIRYGVNFATPWVAAAAAVLIAVAATAFAVRESLDGRRQILVWALRMAAATVVGLLAAYAAARAFPDTHYEAALLRAAAAFFATIVLAAHLADRRTRP